MDFFLRSLYDLGNLLLKVFLIVVPLMIMLEISREFKLLDKLMSKSYPLARRLGFGKNAIYPLLAGLIFGISYGGGILIGESDSGNISGKQLFLVALFLGMCHSVFEDTLLFVAQGANGFIILGTRLSLAIVVTLTASFLLKERDY